VYLLVYCLLRGVRGRVVKVVDFKPLAPHRCVLESRQGLWILSCEEAIQLAYGTSVVLLRCPFVPEIMHGRAPAWCLPPPVNVAKWPILCRCDVKPKTKQTKKITKNKKVICKEFSCTGNYIWKIVYKYNRS
jgi:hypothetical protein